MLNVIEFNGVKYFLRTKGYYESQHPCRQLHRDIYEYYNKCIIPDGFIVHHIDHDPLNNDINNLVAISRSDHSKLHNVNRIVSEETKRLWSAQRKGRTSPNKGKKLGPLSEEHKRKLSQANLIPVSEEMIVDVKNRMSLGKFVKKYNCQHPWTRIRKELGISG